MSEPVFKPTATDEVREILSESFDIQVLNEGFSYEFWGAPGYEQAWALMLSEDEVSFPDIDTFEYLPTRLTITKHVAYPDEFPSPPVDVEARLVRVQDNTATYSLTLKD